MKWYSHDGKQLAGSSQGSTQNYHMIPAILLRGIYPKELKTGTQTDTWTFIAAVITTAERGKQPKCPSMEECLTSDGTFTQWNIRQL